MTDDQIEKLVDGGTRLETLVTILIAQADSGDGDAAQKLAVVIDLYTVRHPDLVVRYMARREIARMKI